MNKKLFLLQMLIILLAFGVTITSCASNKVMFEASIPVDEQVTFIVPGGYWDVFEFSGKPVKWFSLTLFGSTKVIIPSGQHTVKFNYYYDAFNHFNDEELTAEFEAGHTYYMHTQQIGNKIHFGIWDETLKRFVTP